jgi:hypothetical protein
VVASNSSKDYEQFIEALVVGAHEFSECSETRVARRLLVTAEDAYGMQFDCEIRVVAGLSDKSGDWLFLGVQMCGEKRPAVDAASEHQTDIMFLVSETEFGGPALHRADFGAQTDLSSSDALVQTHFSRCERAGDEGYAGILVCSASRRPPRPQSLEPISKKGFSHSGQSPLRERRSSLISSRVLLAPLPNDVSSSDSLTPRRPEGQPSRRGRRSSSQPPSNTDSGRASVLDMNLSTSTLDGHWHAVASENNNLEMLSHWLVRLTIVGETVTLGDGSAAKLTRRDDGCLLLCGG